MPCSAQLQAERRPKLGSPTDDAEMLEWRCSGRSFRLFFSSQGDEQRLYEFIVRHFLACCSQDAQGQETAVEIDIAQERFVAHGLVILARNFLDVYPYDRWGDKVINRRCNQRSESMSHPVGLRARGTQLYSP